VIISQTFFVVVKEAWREENMVVRVVFTVLWRTVWFSRIESCSFIIAYKFFAGYRSFSMIVIDGGIV